jgi:transcriptional regulator with XRE-family HTH domain
MAVKESKPTALALAQRVQDIHMSTDELAGRLGMNVNIVVRVLAGEMPGSEAEQRIVAALDDWEAHGLPELPKASWEREQALPREDRPGTYEYEMKRQQEMADAYHAALARRSEADAAARLAMAAKVKAAAEVRLAAGQEMAELRKASGLTQQEIAVFLNLSVDMLRRLEQGRPYGNDTRRAEVLDGYRLALKMAPKSTKAGTK